MTTDNKTAPKTPDEYAWLPFTLSDFKNADWEADGALDESVERIDNLRRVVLVELADRYGATMVGMGALDRIASALGDAMRALQAHDDASARYDGMVNQMGVPRPAFSKAELQSHQDTITAQAAMKDGGLRI